MSGLKQDKPLGNLRDVSLPDQYPDNVYLERKLHAYEAELEKFRIIADNTWSLEWFQEPDGQVQLCFSFM